MKAYANIRFKALDILLQLSTPYVCEVEISALVNIKTKKRERPKALENKMRECLSKARPYYPRKIGKPQPPFYHQTPLK